MNNYYVYYLIDPRNDLPFYIGKGKDDRMYDHERDVKNGKIPNTNNTYLFRKIKKILNLGLGIIYDKIVDNVSDDVALLWEIKEIKRLGRSNLGLGPLCNLTDGGEGNAGKIVSKNTKDKMSIIARNRLKDPTKHPMYNKHHTHKSKVKMSISGKKRFANPMEHKKTADATRRGMYASGHIDRISKTISMVSPAGETITMKNISLFCRTYNLQNGNLYKVIRGEMKSHRGWTLPQLKKVSSV